ncbi:NDP-hexose 2,3-dehydratase family protein [Fictibacillus phosphorivorans]|uniref:NDP-hexose 2,3-dehydratase family protein n=1 Tax=Fictibacillus phosphorivorans TaxID=1221500 RepID=UPI003CF77A49
MKTSVRRLNYQALINSYRVIDSPISDFKNILDILKSTRKGCSARVEIIPFDKLSSWYFDDKGNLRHESGRYFSIEGLEIINHELGIKKYQPIINQNEHGILGLLTKVINNVSYFLVQFKVEPGNIELVQISPTVQATKSNYSKVHKGKSVPYIEFFTDSKFEDNVIFKRLLSEQGNKFFHKRNYNILVELDEDMDLVTKPGYMWLTLGQISRLLEIPNAINMDLRSIVSCISFLDEKAVKKEYPKNTIGVFNKWLNKKRRYEAKIVSLQSLYDHGWEKSEDKIFSKEDLEFELNCINVLIESREITCWTQPIVKDGHSKLNGLIIKKINGITHVLVQACQEYGSFTGVEIGPSVHNYYAGQDSYLTKYFTNFENSELLYSVNQSEEGGRFYQFINKYMIVSVSQDIPLKENYLWVSHNQLKLLMNMECSINMEARSLISYLNYIELKNG